MMTTDEIRALEPDARRRLQQFADCFKRAKVFDYFVNYSLGLLASLPRLDASTHTKLTPIEGSPPDLIMLPPGCPFHARCRYRIPRCLDENPALRGVGFGDHEIACWVDIKEKRGA